MSCSLCCYRWRDRTLVGWTNRGIRALCAAQRDEPLPVHHLISRDCLSFRAGRGTVPIVQVGDRPSGVVASCPTWTNGTVPPVRSGRPHRFKIEHLTPSTSRTKPALPAHTIPTTTRSKPISKIWAFCEAFHTDRCAHSNKCPICAVISVSICTNARPNL